MIVINGIIVFLVLTATQNKAMLPFAGIYMIIVSIIYLSGILNPISRELSNINKLLKKFSKLKILKKYLMKIERKNNEIYIY